MGEIWNQVAIWMLASIGIFLLIGIVWCSTIFIKKTWEHVNSIHQPINQNWQGEAITKHKLWHYSLEELKAGLKELGIKVDSEGGKKKLNYGAYYTGFLADFSKIPCGGGLYMGSDKEDLWVRYALCLGMARDMIELDKKNKEK